MSWTRELLDCRFNKDRARKRLNQLKAEEARLLVANVPCSLCQLTGGGQVGMPCRKNGHGQVTFPHAERRRAATALIADLQKE
jgi:hypothetical protein